MHFIAFNLSKPKNYQDESHVSMRIVKSKNLDACKAFMRSHYPGHWAIIPKSVFDKGLVNPPLPSLPVVARPYQTGDSHVAHRQD